jgi:pectate lyase
MITSIKSLSFLLGLTLCITACKGVDPEPGPQPATKVLAFPGADGGGKYTTGGRGGVVVHVTTLADDKDPSTGQPAFGTLRKALEMDGARTIVFDVAGTIHLSKQLEIKSGNVTVAGQTAPGDGICIAGYPVVVKASNVIIRFLRFRMGDQNGAEGDALSINDRKNIIVDHCSFSWSTDECVSCYGNTDFTLQYCFITESLKNSVHAKGAHGYGGIWGGTNASFHHNLFAHHQSRNPRFDHDYVNVKCGGPIDYVNNVVYNWESNAAYGGEGTNKGAGGRHINFVNNYYKPGPSTKSGVKTRLVDPWTKCDNCVASPGGTVEAPKIYLVGNTMTSSSEVTSDNWKGSTQSKSVAGTDTRWTEGLTALTNEQTASEAFETVLTKAGCSLHRDAIDTRIVNEVRNGTGQLVNTPSDAGGYPTLDPGTVLVDTDRDGMPDAWEDENGLDKNSSADSKLYTLHTAYTNLEVYLNNLVNHLL